MIKMKSIGYVFFAGALLHLVLAFIIVLSLQVDFYIFIFLSLALLFPVMYYLQKCPSNMPLKKCLWTFVLFSVYMVVWSIYTRYTWESLGDMWSEQLEQFVRTNKLFEQINNLVLMIIKVIVLWNMIKLSKKRSFVWWTCVANLVIALEPIILLAIRVYFYNDNNVQYMNTIGLIRNLGFVLLYLSIGLFLIPKSN